MKPTRLPISVFFLLTLFFNPVEGINKQQLVSLVKGYFANQFNVPVTDVVVNIVNPPRRDLSAVSIDKIRVSSRTKIPRLGYQSLWLSVPSEGVYQEPMSVRLSVYKTVAVARHTIARNETLSGENVVFKRVLLSSFDPKPVTEIDSLNGFISRQVIQEGKVLKQYMITVSPDIIAGEKVKVLLSRGTLTVIANARTKSDACIGDKVRVVCDNTRKTLTARVINKDTVMVEY